VTHEHFQSSNKHKAVPIPNPFQGSSVTINEISTIAATAVDLLLVFVLYEMEREREREELLFRFRPMRQ